MIILFALISAEIALLLYLFYEVSLQFLHFFNFKKKVECLVENYDLMANLSAGFFVGTIVAVIVTTKILFIAVYTMAAILSFLAMIDFNYKSKYNKEKRN